MPSDTATAPNKRKRNRKDKVGRPSGEASRARILNTAGQLFAERGYNGVSTRELAKAANVNVSAIGYYFRGKKGLYRAVLQQLIEDTEPIFEPAAARIKAGVAAAGSDREALTAITRDLIGHLLRAVLGDARMRWQMGLMLREFHQPSDGFAILLEHRVHPMHDAVAELGAAATGRPAGTPETLLLTCAVIGQCMAFGAARNLVCARLDWPDYTEAAIDQVIETVTRVVLSALGLAERGVPGSAGSC